MAKRPGIIGLLVAAIARKEAILAGLEGAENPQLVQMRHELRGEMEAYQICLDALRGDTVLLRLAGEDLSKKEVL
jgi:hypothetical protein